MYLQSSLTGFRVYKSSWSGSLEDKHFPIKGNYSEIFLFEFLREINIAKLQTRYYIIY